MYLDRQRGVVQLFVFAVMAFLVLSLPLSTKSVQQNQENRILAYSRLGQSCKYTSGCQPPLICSNSVCKKGVVRTENQGLNQSCTNESDCRSPYVCYPNSSTCKVRSGGECSGSGDCYTNHYCSRTNNHCKDKSEYNLGDYSVEGVSLSSMLGGPNSNPRPISVKGRCGLTNNSCNSGSISDVADSSISYLWRCLGKNGGLSVSCSVKKTSSSYIK